MAFALAGFMSAIQPNHLVRISDPLDEAARYREAVTALASDVRRLEIGRTLRANPDATTRLIVPDKCQTEGEAEIHNYALSGNVEESFIFIPALCLWIEIGYDKKGGSIRLDLDFITAVLSQYKVFTIYHAHPASVAVLEENLPSYTDLVTLILINADQILEPNFEVKHRIATRLGIAEYEFIDKRRVKTLIEYYRKTGLTGFEAQNLAYEYLRSRYRNAYYSEVTRCKKYSGAIEQQLIRCSPIRTEAFIVTFRPHTADHQ